MCSWACGRVFGRNFRWDVNVIFMEVEMNCGVQCVGFNVCACVSYFLLYKYI